MLELVNVTKHFGGVHALDGVSLTVKKGKITALIGPNGSGKSTLFNVVCGVLPLDSGKVFFNKKEISSFKIEQISNLGVSRIFQKPHLFSNMSVLDNLLLAFDNEDQKLVKSFFGLNSLSKEKVSEAKSALEELGLSSLETKQASELSYGQKRLVELTRAILKPHELLMLDEPVAGVTPALRKKISDSLLLLKKKGHTILLVEHDMPFTLNIADEVIVLDEGKIIASGNPKEIKKNKKVLEAYLGD